MAWVTKSSDETYNPAPPPREYTQQEKAANWWHYHKFAVLAAAAVLALAGWLIHDVVTQVEPDLKIAYVGPVSLPLGMGDAIEAALTPYCEDYNGDGDVVVEVAEYTVDFEDDQSSVDPYSQMAGITRLTTELAPEYGTCLFLLADPEGFQEFAKVLQYPDGTLPPEDEAGDWRQMVRRWSDCPALTALDLGEFNGEDAPGVLYFGCRGFTPDLEVPASYEPSMQLWQTLTAGAPAPAQAAPAADLATAETAAGA